MGKFWIAVIAVFLISCFIVWKLSLGYYRKEYGDREWNLWGAKTFYWQSVILLGGGMTYLIMFLLIRGEVLVF